MRFVSKRFFCHAGLLLAVFSSLSTLPSLALAESILQVLPTRVVLEGGKRSVTVTLINRGDEEGNYRMFFRNIRANDNGEFSEIETAIEGERFADNANTVTKDAYTRVDVGATYKINLNNTDVNLRLNIENLFDTNYLAGGGLNNVTIGEGASVRLAAQFSF